MSRIDHHYVLPFMLFCLLVAAILRLPDLSVTPPGLHYDEATNGLLAADIGLRGSRPIFTSGYTGQEVLFFYLAGGFMRLIGQSIFTLRLTAACIGILTVAATYWLGREMLADRRVALIAAALLAVSFWHLLFSRLGLRAISQPLLQALAVASLFRGLRLKHGGWLVIGGVFLGLTGYTYLASRLFPILLLLAALPLLLNRPRWRQLILYAAVGLVVLAPLLFYFINHPDTFGVRIDQVTVDATRPALTIPASYLKSLKMFFLAGDPYLRFNLPGRPLFNWFWGSFLVVGWILCLVRWPRLATDWQRTAFLLLILTPPIMILPTALAVREIVPSNLRVIGLIPFIFYLPAIGLVALLQDLKHRLHWLRVTPAILAVGALILIAGGIFTARAYFQTWAIEPALYYQSDGDLMAVAHFLNEIDITGKTIYVSSVHYRHPTLAFSSPHYDEVKWLLSSRALVFPAQGPAIYIYPQNSPFPSWIKPYLAAAVPLDTLSDPEGQPAFVAYEVTEPPSVHAPNPVNANFGNVMTLLGYQVESAAAGATMPLILYWRVDGAVTADFSPFVHLEDEWQYRWSQAETSAYLAEQWEPGEIIIQRVDVPVRPGTPPGNYRLRVGLFTQSTGERLPRLEEDGRYAGDAVIIENAAITVGVLPDVLPHPPVTLDQPIRPGLRLLGYERSDDQALTGDDIGLALWWWATAPLPQLTTRLELMRSDNTGRILANTQPVHDTYPFGSWETPQFLIDHQAPRIPDALPPGDYRLHLRLLDGNDETLFTADLGPLSIEATERRFTPPSTPHPLAATLGNEIDLLGYDLTATEGARQFTLSLVWQAQTQPAADYTVFVHVLGLDGVCCVWQQDVMPQQNHYPTSRWLAGEVVIDVYQIALPAELPAGGYPFEVGLYLAETGQRLQVTVPGLEASDVVYLQPLPVR